MPLCHGQPRKLGDKELATQTQRNCHKRSLSILIDAFKLKISRKSSLNKQKSEKVNYDNNMTHDNVSVSVAKYVEIYMESLKRPNSSPVFPRYCLFRLSPIPVHTTFSG